MPIKQLVYASRQVFSFDGLGLVSLLYRARERNQRMGITGVLFYSEGLFVQCLEGGDAEVDALFERIAADPRHEDVVVLQAIETGERHFDQWSMGCAKIDAFQGLRLMRVQWESELGRIDRENTFSPGFVLMKSIWDMYKDHGVLDDLLPEGAAAPAADPAQSRH